MLTITVGSAGGRDYSAIQSAWDSIASPLTDDYTIALYNDTEFTFPDSYVNCLDCTGVNAKTMAGHTVTITPAAGQGFRDHASKLTNPLRYNASVGVGINGKFAYTSQAGLLLVDGVILDGLQIRGWATSGFGGCVTGGAVRNCIIESSMSAIFVNDVRNSVVIVAADAGRHAIEVDSGSAYLIANTLVNLLGGNRAIAGHSTATITAINNAAYNFTDFFTSYETAALVSPTDYNATDASSIAVGTHNVTSLTSAAFAGWTTDATTIDLRVSSGTSALVGAGSSLAYDAHVPTTDIVGSARSSTASTIGAWEYATVATTDYYLGSDIGAGNWTPSTGATLYGCVDEATADDADYIQSGVNPTADACSLGFPAVQTPSANTNHALSYRIKGDGGAALLVEIVAGDGTTVIGGDTPGAGWLHNPADSTWTQYDRTLSTTEADAWAAAGYIGSKLRLTANP